MQQEFISLYGKVILENEVLFIRKCKPSLTVDQFVVTIFPLLIITRFVFYLFEDSSPKRNMALVVLGLLSVFYGIELVVKLYKVAFNISFANRIPVRQIRSFRVEDDRHDLDVHLYIQLRTGRERMITFRKREKQHEALIAAVSQYLALSNFSC